MKDGRLELAQMVLLPKLFRLDDLNDMPLSIVRERGINLGTAAVNRASEWHPSVAQEGSFKRSTAFLRFAVGQRQLTEHEDWGAGEDGLCERLEKLTTKRYQTLPGTVLPRASHLHGLVPRGSVLGNVAVPGAAAGSACSRQSRAGATEGESGGPSGDSRPRVPIRNAGRLLRWRRSDRRSRLPAKVETERGSAWMRIADQQATRGGRRQDQGRRGLHSAESGNSTCL